MGYVFAMGLCFGCGNPFTFNPTKVPSIRVQGVARPICLACVTRVNPMRVKNGLEPIVPLPGAYEECSEEELG
jgi:hypothetical protein